MRSYGIACHEAKGQANDQENLYPELIMVDNSNNHISSLLLRQHVKCAAKHIDNELYVVKEKVQNHFECIDHIKYKVSIYGSAYQRLTTQCV